MNCDRSDKEGALVIVLVAVDMTGAEATGTVGRDVNGTVGAEVTGTVGGDVNGTDGAGVNGATEGGNVSSATDKMKGAVVSRSVAGGFPNIGTAVLPSAISTASPDI